MKKLQWIVIVFLAAFAVGTLGVFVWSGFRGAVFSVTEARGQQGDFIGGHLSALFSSITLIAVLYFGWRQREEDKLRRQKEGETRKREAFLAGLDLICQYDIKSPGSEQAMRILDYYSKLAVDDGSEDWLWMLNTVITKAIRKNLDDLMKDERDIYPHAQAARLKIQEMLETYHKERKGLDLPPGTGGLK
jgi:uncharacterized membrane protein